MYRYPPEAQRPSVLTVAGLISQEHPGLFVPIEHTRPHVSILSRQALIMILNGFEAENPVANITEMMSELYQGLQPDALKPADAIFSSVDFFGNSLGIVLDSSQASKEIDFAYSSVFERLGSNRRKTDNRPHLSVGRVSAGASFKQQEAVLDTAAEVCAMHLPGDRRLTLGAVSLIGPSRSGSQHSSDKLAIINQ